MSGYRTKFFLASLILAGLALSSFAQNSADPAPEAATTRRASFLPADQAQTDVGTGVSGLATGAPAPLMPQEQNPAPPAPPASASSVAPVAQAASPAVDLSITPVAAAALPNVSPESIGTPGADGLGADIWKGTPHITAERLLPLMMPTRSPVLNKLARRMLATAAVPPEGAAETAQSLTSTRIEKLVMFGDTAAAWALAKHADPKLVDDITWRLVVESTLINPSEDLCPQAAAMAKERPAVDWQKMTVVCALRAKDNPAAQVALDVMHTQSVRDNVFLSIADKNILGNGKTLPLPLTPLTPATLALLQIANLPLPGSLFGRADFALAPMMLKLPVQQDVAQLALAERAAENGFISGEALAAVYRGVKFNADALASPLTSTESGLRLRALLYMAATAEKDPAKRAALAIKFAQSASPSFLNGAGAILGDILGTIPVDGTLGASAAPLARLYLLAGKNDAAAAWLKLAQSAAINADELQNAWPQFALAGLMDEEAFAAGLDKWLSAALKNAEDQNSRDAVAASLLLLDAAGSKIPDTAWVKVLAVAHQNKHAAFSPVLLDRLQSAASAGRRAETVALAVALAGEDEISMPVAQAITRALRAAGFKTEATAFARNALAGLGK